MYYRESNKLHCLQTATKMDAIVNRITLLQAIAKETAKVAKKVAADAEKYRLRIIALEDSCDQLQVQALANESNITSLQLASEVKQVRYMFFVKFVAQLVKFVAHLVKFVANWSDSSLIGQIRR